jgi:exopolysaccharide production protein ExoY
MPLRRRSCRDDIAATGNGVHHLAQKSAVANTHPIGGAGKRTIDVVVALLALLLFLPLFLFVAAIVKCCDPGPVLYVHRRVGYASRSFGCLKFRTMVVNGDEVLRKHLQYSPEAAREWAQTRKLKRDPRVTAVGLVLRKLSIDELPQLINVLRGEMSVVGPRPIVHDEIQMYGQDARFYLRSRPGLTGAWQISGRNDETYARRVSLDRQYVENWSLWGDAIIIVRTIPVLMSAKGSY